MKKYCAHCNLVVASYDPDRIVRNGEVYHGKCYRDMIMALMPLAREDLKEKVIALFSSR